MSRVGPAHKLEEMIRCVAFDRSGWLAARLGLGASGGAATDQDPGDGDGRHYAGSAARRTPSKLGPPQSFR